MCAVDSWMLVLLFYEGQRDVTENCEFTSDGAADY